MNEIYLKQLIRDKLIGKEFQPLIIKVSNRDEFDSFVRVVNIEKCYLDPTFKVVNLYTTDKKNGEITWTFLKIYTKIEGKYYEILFHRLDNAPSVTYEDSKYFTYDDYEVMHINNYLKVYDECVAADNAKVKNYKTVPVEAPKYSNDIKNFEKVLFSEEDTLKPLCNEVTDTAPIQGHRMSKEETAAMIWQEEARLAKTINRLEEDLGTFGIAIKDASNNFRPIHDVFKDCADRFKEPEDTKAQEDTVPHIKTPEDIAPYIKSVEAINIQKTNGTVTAIDYVPGSFSINKSMDILDFSNDPTDPDQQVWISSRHIATKEIKTFSFETACSFGIPSKWVTLEVLCEATDGNYYWITFKASDINSSLERNFSCSGGAEITGYWQSMEIKKVEQVIETINNITTGFIYNDITVTTTHIHNIQSLVINSKDKIFTINLNDIKEYVTSPKEIWKITLHVKDEEEEIDTVEIFLDDDYCDVHSELTPTGSSITGHFKEIKKYNLRKTVYNQIKDITSDGYFGNKTVISDIIEDIATKDLSTTETKEENNMFDNIFGKYDFGEVKDKNIAYSPYGIALRDSAGDYVVYNVDGSVGTNIGKDMIFDLPMLKLPATYEDIKSGDIIVHYAIGNAAYVIVKEKTADGITVIDPADKTIKTLVPEKNIFGFEFYVKVMPPFNMDAVKPTKDNPFGNLMLPMIMSKNGNDDMFKYLMLMQMGSQIEFNPMMFMLMGKDNENSNDSFFKYMMFSQMGNFTIGNSNSTIEK